MSEEINPAVELSVVGSHETVVLTQPRATKPPPTPDDNRVVIDAIISRLTIEQEMMYAGRVRAHTGRSMSIMEVVEKMSGLSIGNLPVPMALLKKRDLSLRSSHVRITVEWVDPDATLPE